MSSFDFRLWLYGLSKSGVKLGLDRMKELLRRLGDPQKQFSAIHIGGTNGKGSTAAFCASLLMAAGRACLQQKVTPGKIGLYTSPHLLRVTERIQYSDPESHRLMECSEGELNEALGQIYKVGSSLELSFFEAITAAAFCIFAQQEVKLAIVEVGLGGRLDATQLCEPICSVITSISYDHTEILGDTLSEIAYEKSGIFRPFVPAYAACEDVSARQVLLRQANKEGCPLVMYDSDLPISVPKLPESLISSISLPGKHQLRNAALALAAVHHAPYPWRGPLQAEQVQKEGLLATRWPGRLEQIYTLPNQAKVWVDAAHNQEGANALEQWISVLPGKPGITILFGIVKEKPVVQMLAPLRYAQTVIITRPISPRGLDPSQIFAVLRKELPSNINILSFSDLEEALSAAIQSTCAQGVLIAYGSIFLIGHVRRILLGEPSDKVVLQDPSRPVTL